MEGYPLHFKYADYATIGGRGDFAQQMVVEELAKILLGYGVEQLAVHLQEAIEEADRKYQDYRRNSQAKWQRPSLQPRRGRLLVFGVGHHLQEVIGLAPAESKWIEGFLEEDIITKNHGLQCRVKWDVDYLAVFDDRSSVSYRDI
ncbi:putative alpha-ketoglutarate-dependent sulfonate dioxygenase [Diaporthe ampelina]|uniref:Putative alpha-ketoglutarate-dependent sulfonate dioxygenase n=1 Tax=Diaporthe ampelina TaxID=1214573 RepID=A0A0G2H336_9PEZI|nr:putative alpha-ketoglutarate-dependent sulfonate dioxygenase [Diaporthe ampelina]